MNSGSPHMKKPSSVWFQYMKLNSWWCCTSIMWQPCIWQWIAEPVNCCYRVLFNLLYAVSWLCSLLCHWPLAFILTSNLHYYMYGSVRRLDPLMGFTFTTSLCWNLCSAFLMDYIRFLQNDIHLQSRYTIISCCFSYCP
jgi:hypothetical protein